MYTIVASIIIIGITISITIVIHKTPSNIHIRRRFLCGFAKIYYL